MTHWRSPNAGCSWPETPPGSQQTTRQRFAFTPVPNRCRGLSFQLAEPAPVLPITGTEQTQASQGTDGKTVPINSSDIELAMWIFLGLFLGGISFAFALIYLLLVSQL